MPASLKLLSVDRVSWTSAQWQLREIGIEAERIAKLEGVSGMR